jgi:ParB/RepB/Spo0J family partition protein
MDKIIDVPVSQVQTDTAQPRQIMDQDKMKHLREDIQERGLLYPILVTPFVKVGETLLLGRKAIDKGNYKFWLLDGYRRVVAHKELKMETIKAIQKLDLSFLEMLEIQFASNSKRVQISIEEMATSITRFKQEFYKTDPDGDVIKRLVNLTGFSSSYFDMAEAINRSSKPLQREIHSGNVGGYAAYEIERSTKDPSLKKGLTDFYVKQASVNKKISALLPRTIKTQLKTLENNDGYTPAEKEKLAFTLMEDRIVKNPAQDATSNFAAYKFAFQEFIKKTQTWQLKGLTGKEIDVLLSLAEQTVSILREERRKIGKVTFVSKSANI